MEKNDTIIIYGTDYKSIAKRMLEQTDVAPDIGDRDKLVTLEPNLATARDPSSGTTIHVELLVGVIEYLQEHGFTYVTVMEGSWVGDHTGEVLRAAGHDRVCSRYHVPFEDLQKDIWKEYNAASMKIKLRDKAAAVDYMTNIPVLKGHCQTTVICALKNNEGVIPNPEKRRSYTLGLRIPITHSNTITRNDFILVDNICGDLDFEESGSPVVMNRVLGFKDPVPCDSLVCDCMGYPSEDVPCITIAEHLGVGSTDTAHASMIHLNQASEANSHFKMARRAQNLAAYTPPKDACSARYGSLIYILDRLNDSGFLHKKLSHICIGQGYRGKEGEIGVGQCTSYFAKTLRGCPPKATDIMEFLSENWKQKKGTVLRPLFL